MVADLVTRQNVEEVLGTPSYAAGEQQVFLQKHCVSQEQGDDMKSIPYQAIDNRAKTRLRSARQ